MDAILTRYLVRVKGVRGLWFHYRFTADKPTAERVWRALDKGQAAVLYECKPINFYSPDGVPVHSLDIP